MTKEMEKENKIGIALPPNGAKIIERISSLMLQFYAVPFSRAVLRGIPLDMVDGGGTPTEEFLEMLDEYAPWTLSYMDCPTATGEIIVTEHGVGDGMSISLANIFVTIGSKSVRHAFEDPSRSVLKVTGPFHRAMVTTRTLDDAVSFAKVASSFGTASSYFAKTDSGYAIELFTESVELSRVALDFSTDDGFDSDPEIIMGNGRAVEKLLEIGTP